MGIKFFYKWLSQTYGHCFKSFKKSAPPSDVCVDTFLIDMNGLFHNSAQRIFKYGNGAPRSLLARPVQKVPFNEHTQRLCFDDISNTLEQLVQLVNPRKTLVLAIDGVAPASKINQQRQRRFRSVIDTIPSQSEFTSIMITPGTKFMDKLSRYIDWYIRKRISECPRWAAIKVVFSNEKQPGEGEHKLVEYIRKYGTDEETYCINALDADLVMLSLATFKPNFFLLREELYANAYDYSYVSISELRQSLEHDLHWDGCTNETLIKDFILICFLCGNDFLPHIPSISIIENGLETIINMYKTTCNETKSHFVNDQNQIILPVFKLFLEHIGNCEHGMLIRKAMNKTAYIRDPLLEKHTFVAEVQLATESTSEPLQTIDVALDEYKKEYYASKDIYNVEAASKQYIKGCQWVLEYYLSGVYDWLWVYPYNYTPFASEIASHVDSKTPIQFVQSRSLSAFEQLLCVIPPKCAWLLPDPLDLLLKSSQLREFCPSNIKINLDGKKYEYEGVVELPPVDTRVISREYGKIKNRISEADLRRNVFGKMFGYTKGDVTDVFKSQFGDLHRHSIDQTIL